MLAVHLTVSQGEGPLALGGVVALSQQASSDSQPTLSYGSTGSGLQSHEREGQMARATTCCLFIAPCTPEQAAR